MMTYFFFIDIRYQISMKSINLQYYNIRLIMHTYVCDMNNTVNLNVTNSVLDKF